MTLYKVARAACFISITINMLTGSGEWAIFYLLVLRFYFNERSK